MEEATQTLYTHDTYYHEPQNVNTVHAEAHPGMNTRIAVFLTRCVSTMWTAYLFTVLAFIGLFGLLGWLNPFIFLLTTWISQQFLQLVFLPILSVGQNVMSQKQELLADQQYLTTQKTYHDLEEFVAHLHAQDAKVLSIEAKVDHLIQLLETPKSTRKKTEALK